MHTTVYIHEGVCFEPSSFMHTTVYIHEGVCFEPSSFMHTTVSLKLSDQMYVIDGDEKKRKNKE